MLDVSFIIPVFNSKKYIESCVHSILKAISLNQIRYEIILIDDGSTDGSEKICDFFNEKYTKIKVIHQKNGGICAARNVGIKNAKGKWICFLDHDDLFDAKGIEVIEKHVDDWADIIYFGYTKFTEEKNIFKNKVIEKEIIFSNSEIKKLQWDCLCRYSGEKPLMDYMLLSTPWGKIYNREYLIKNNFYFNEKMQREEDIAFNLMCLSNAKKLKYISYEIYHHRVFSDSESHSYKENIFRQSCETLEVYKEIIEKYYPNDMRMIELYKFRKLWELLYCVVLGAGHPHNPMKYSEKRREFCKLFDSEVYKNVFLENDINKLPIQHRILAYMIKNKFFSGVCILNIFKCKILGKW